MFQKLNFKLKKYLNILLFIYSFGILFSNESILNYETELELHNDGSLFIIENITVKAEGNKIQRGIMRNFPTKYNTLNIPTPINNKPKIEIRSKQPTEFTAPAKRFSRNTLAVLGDVASNITCECPHHLTELVIGLSNFEDYSAECVSKSPDDAELHAYLQSTTAKCRASMEEALEKVAIAEGIDFKTLG